MVQKCHRTHLLKIGIKNRLKHNMKTVCMLLEKKNVTSNALQYLDKFSIKVLYSDI